MAVSGSIPRCAAACRMYPSTSFAPLLTVRAAPATAPRARAGRSVTKPHQAGAPSSGAAAAEAGCPTLDHHSGGIATDLPRGCDARHSGAPTRRRYSRHEVQARWRNSLAAEPPPSPTARAWLATGVLLILPGTIVTYLLAPQSLLSVGVLLVGVGVGFVGSVLSERR